MSSLLPAVHPATTDMIQCWPHRDKLSGDLLQTGHTLTTTTTTTTTTTNNNNNNNNSSTKHTATTSKTSSPLTPSSPSPSSSSFFTITAPSLISSYLSSSSPLSPLALTPRHQSSRAEGSAACVRTSRRLNGFTQVRQLPGRCVLVLLLLAILVSSRPVMAKPWIKEGNDSVTFTTNFCKPLTNEELQKLIDSSPMPINSKRTAPDLTDQSLGYQGDDPYVTQESDLMGEEGEWEAEEEEWIGEREEDIFTEDGMVREGQEVVDRRSWRKSWPQRVTSSEGGQYPGYRDKDRVSQAVDSDKQTDSDSYPYMRRRRRSPAGLRDSGSKGRHNKRAAASEEDEEEEDEEEEEEEDSVQERGKKKRKKGKKSSKRKKSLDRNDYLRVTDKKQRRLLKKKFREQGKLSKPPPWQCTMVNKNLLMEKGYYPTSLASGDCGTNLCFYRLFKCKPVTYMVKILKRDISRCNPRPSLTNVTEYEEHWEAEQYEVTVGCVCDSNMSTKQERQKYARKH